MLGILNVLISLFDGQLVMTPLLSTLVNVTILYFQLLVVFCLLKSSDIASKNKKKNSWKRVEGMASRDTFLQRHSGSVELLSFVPKKEQKDFSQYLYSNYQVWNKERRRCFYRCRKFKKNSDYQHCSLF